MKDEVARERVSDGAGAGRERRRPHERGEGLLLLAELSIQDERAFDVDPRRERRIAVARVGARRVGSGEALEVRGEVGA